MPLKKKARSNTMASQDKSDHGDSESRQKASRGEEEPASEEAYTLTDLIAANYVMWQTQKEIVDTIKELKSSVSKPSKEHERTLLPKRVLSKKGRLSSPRNMSLL
ncbi:unnamed protein product [Prunus brigantina]